MQAVTARQSGLSRFVGNLESVRKTVKWRSKLWLRAQLAANLDDHPDDCRLDPGKPLYVGARLDRDVDETERAAAVPGNWDVPWQLSKLADSALYEAMRQHFVSRVPWETTLYYQQLRSDLSSGRQAVGCQTEAQLTALAKTWDHQYAALEETGLVNKIWPDPVHLAIARHGDLVVLSGQDQIAMARLAGVQKVPAKITLRHAQWVQFCKQFRCFLETEPGGQAYHPVTHVDLQHLPAKWSDNRFQIIASYLKRGRGRLMDIGTNLGYFCHCAESMGYDCVAVESCPRLAYFAEKLRRADNRSFRVLHASVLDYPFDEQFDVVLALNIFHHFLKSKRQYDAFMAMLGRMKSRTMIFQAHRPDETQMRDSYRDFTPERFVQFILDNSQFDDAEEIGVDRERRIYLLTRRLSQYGVRKNSTSRHHVVKGHAR